MPRGASRSRCLPVLPRESSLWGMAEGVSYRLRAKRQPSMNDHAPELAVEKVGTVSLD